MNSCDLGRPNRYCFQESDTAWRSITVSSAAIVIPVIGGTAHTIYAMPCKPGTAQSITLSEVHKDFDGVLALPTPGEWYLRFPLAGSAAAQICVVVIECGSPESMNALLRLMGVTRVLIGSPTGSPADVRNADADADFLDTLNGLLTNSRLAVSDAGTWKRLAGANADAEVDFAAALIGAITNSRMAAFRVSAADWRRIETDPVNTITGEAVGTSCWAKMASAIFGRDTSDSTLRAIEAFGATSALGTSLYRLLVDAAIRTYDVNAGFMNTTAGIEVLHQGALSTPGVSQPRRDGYWGSRAGRRYRTGTDDMTGVAAATGFVATTPTFLLVAGATAELIIRKIRVGCPLVGTKTSFRVLVKTDTADRFSAGGTTRTPTTWNAGNAIASGVGRSLEAPTATAEGAGTRIAATSVGPVVAGGLIELDLRDGLIIPASGSLLVYVVGATAAPTVDLDIEFEEANIQ